MLADPKPLNEGSLLGRFLDSLESTLPPILLQSCHSNHSIPTMANLLSKSFPKI